MFYNCNLKINTYLLINAYILYIYTFLYIYIFIHFYIFYFYRNTLEEVPWAILLLHQFRFLDVTNVDILTTNIQQLLETCPLWFQNELISFLPDILPDAQHQIIAEVLTKMLEENCELTNVILNCIASFNLGKEYLEEYKIKVLHLLKTNIKIELIPIVIRYIYILNVIYILSI